MFIQSFLLLLALNSLSAGRVIRPEERIIGGQPIGIEVAPWQVSIQRYGGHLCGGSIYSAEIIISAAHCFSDLNAQEYQVRVGSALNNSNGSVVEVAAIKIHENFERLENDIAIVLLSKPLEFTNQVQPIPLATTNPSPGSTAFVSGWGTTSYESHPTHLQGVNLYIQWPYYCGLTEQSRICAGSYGRTACNGDSGGPLVVGQQLVGVVSGGSEDCTYSALYTSVPYFREWILNAIKQIMSAKPNK
ncbi:trypsin alpha [Drosophila sechellia]|uniref:trypsin n=2 Tax=melanogaster subgroup TaxID=32351 RepID=A7DZ58_DROSI|nr:trypsin alpha [Drosophila sechellia]XP_002079444.1 trypsin alpha [Drosophila simulans]EDW51740.1 GM14874 [Drosophila sechellia]EDX05029.1 GD22013 [Drosophila simulans]KMY90237.1 uncharacterized protein Dsimw501_GD22013 [Drosophila simulans]CAO78861.1 serine protease [Drosophila simulans]CAO78864.1 serine protease [Drosophila simulans]